MDKFLVVSLALLAGITVALFSAMGPDIGRNWERQPAALAPGTETGKEAVQVCFPNKCIQAELADTPEERKQGLMDRESLEENRGMAFVFETEARHAFWMKNTLIPLDMIWLDKEKKVVHIETAVPCTTDRCKSYTPSAKALYVVEANAGFAMSNGVEVGDAVEFEI